MSSQPPHEAPGPDQTGFARDAASNLWDDAKGAALVALPILVGAALGFLVADGPGLVVGALVGAALVALYFAYGAFTLVRDGVRRVRGRSRP
ncbi:hypothetical protein NOK12_20490 [Nocardioides sp. OK12]|uniref:hypothetical protein n=1 Tax=Nocardioides sp. OK12 TaxID=2758661 RepID=UPI0021C4823F|nr:hypothetical protein [Nocardioides sp. OK12]GHJ59531.1 hypothetical protein NOK12_20490 [Nocardioides sp. OK12]